MAARKLRKFHTEEIRAKIQASQLINRLTDHAFGKVELSATQVRSIEVLLKKSVPDLQSIDLNGAGDNGEHLHKIVREFHTPHSNG